MNEETMKILADAAMIEWDGSMAREMETLRQIIESAASSPLAEEKSGSGFAETEAMVLTHPDENGLRVDEVQTFPYPVSAAAKGYDGTYIVVPKVL